MFERAVPLVAAIPQATWRAAMDLWEDDPEGFAALVESFSRRRRPTYGGVSVTLVGGKITGIEVRDARKV